MLGKGSFGEVYKVAHKKSGEIYAMKVLRKQNVFGKNLLRYTMTERNLMSYIKHPFIVGLHYAFQTSTVLVLVLQFCPNGNLSDVLKREGWLVEDVARLYFAETFLAIEYLHERHVVYRDMKPENVVLDEQDHAMLTDFGLSKEGVDDPQGTGSFCGSIAYLAPEVLARTGHGKPLDIYGLGVLLYEMLVGRPPFYTNSRKQLFKNIAQAKLYPPSSASPDCAQFVLGLMAREPDQRIGARDTSQIRHHAFLSPIDFDALLTRSVDVPDYRRKKSEADSPELSLLAKEKVPNPFKLGLMAKIRPPSEGDVDGWSFAAAAPPSMEAAEPPDEGGHLEALRRLWWRRRARKAAEREAREAAPASGQ